MARITKAAVEDALDFVRKDANERQPQAQQDWRDGREKDGSYHDGVIQGMRIAVMSIESRLLRSNAEVTGAPPHGA